MKLQALLCFFVFLRELVECVHGTEDGHAPAETPFSGPECPTPYHEGLFNVMHYGAIADGETESSSAFAAAWRAACGHNGSSIFYIPEGTYFVGAVSFSGPCFNKESLMVKIEGTLIAPPYLRAFPKSNWIEFRHLNRIILTGNQEEAIIDGQGEFEAWKQISCEKSITCNILITSLKFSNVSNGVISNISLSNGKGFHVGLVRCTNMRIENITITAPWDSPNTDGIHASQSTNITIASSTIGVGDDCVSIGPGNINISISDLRCGPGHGISVGSLGKYQNEDDVIGISAKNCFINGTKNGVRIKTWKGSQKSSASNITFEDIKMINVSNPIIIDQEYCPSGSCKISKPSLVKLSNIFIKNISGTYNTKSAVTLLCSSIVPCENIQLSDINLNSTTPNNHGKYHLNVKGVINDLQIL